MPPTRRLIALLVAGAFLVACGEEPSNGGPARTDESPPPPPKPYGFAVWHTDFPGAPEKPDLSPAHPGTYDRTDRQALVSVTRKLQGNTTYDAWLFAKDFFTRLDPADADVLVVELDRALQVPTMADLAENIVESMGRVGSPTLAPALLRALQHPRDAIRTKVMQSLVESGDADSVRQASAALGSVDAVGKKAWLHAARLHLPSDEVVKIYQDILADPRQKMMHELVVEQAEQLEPAIAVKVFEPWVGREPPGARMTMAGLRHAAGDRGGTAVLQQALQSESPETRAQALRALGYGEPGPLLDDVLALTTAPEAEIRAAVVDLLGRLEGDNVEAALETMAEDPSMPVRRSALLQLSLRGRHAMLDDIVDEIRAATGTRLNLAVDEAVAARYGGAVPALRERMQSASGNEKLQFVRAIALTTSPEAFGVLRDVFLSSEAWAERERGQVAYLMANLRGAEGAIIALFRELPQSDYRRRALLLSTLANIGADREDTAIREQIEALLWEVLKDRSELPQLRLSALEQLRRGLTIEDVGELRRMMRDENDPMRRALSDVLFEFF